MLDTAAELFSTQGYHATGLNQLTSAGGAPKGSLYFHFPGGKEQLAAEALRISGDRLRVQLAAILTHAPNAADGLAAVVDALARNLTESDFTRGCPIATAALDAAGESEPIRQACAAGYASWRAEITAHLVAQGVDSGRAEALSIVALTSIEGALLLAKTQRDTAPLHAIGEHLRITIERELP